MTQFVISFIFIFYLPGTSQTDDPGKCKKSLSLSQSNNLPFVKIQSYNKRPARSITVIVLSTNITYKSGQWRRVGIASGKLWESIFSLSFSLSLSLSLSLTCVFVKISVCNLLNSTIVAFMFYTRLFCIIFVLGEDFT